MLYGVLAVVNIAFVKVREHKGLLRVATIDKKPENTAF
jgi:hypothetical protein